MSLSLRTTLGLMGLAVLLAAVLLLPGGCPATSTGGGTDVAGTDTENPGDGNSDGSTGDSNDGTDNDGAAGTDTSGDGTFADGNDGDTSTDGTDGSTDNTTDPNATDVDGFTAATIIHRAAGGFAADPKFGIPDASCFNVSDGGIQTSVRIPHVSKDGSRIWFAAQDGNGFVQPQLFCMNTDGSGLQEIALPSDLMRVPVELWPSADGQVCVLIIDTGNGMDFSQTTVRIADRRTGQITLLLDGRLLKDGNDDFDNVQITDDGATVYFKDSRQHIIYRIPASGGSLTPVLTLADFTKDLCTAREIADFRINGDASALVANIRFNGPGSNYSSDIYLYMPLGMTALTATGDAPQSLGHEYLGVSDDSRYVVYRRLFSSPSRYRAYVLDRDSNVTTELPTGASSYSTILDSAGSVIFTAHAIDRPYGGIDQLAALVTPNAASALEVVEGWAGTSSLPPYITSMSAGADVLVGTWANGEFGDPARLYAWFPNATSYRDGPSVTGVSYKLDATAGTLTVRATISGTITKVVLHALYQNFESFYQLEDAQDPFLNDRFGTEMTATDTPGVYEQVSSLRGLTLDSDFRIRVTAGDSGAKNYAYVDFRPVPLTGETVDVNGDGIAD